MAFIHASGGTFTVEIVMDRTRLHDPDTLAADRDPQVEAFFDTLLAEQTRFLHAVGGAAAGFGCESGQLANVVAVQCRLTRQFFDAQRQIMAHRAEIDTEVGAIASLEQPCGPAAPDWRHHEVAACGVAAIATMDDVESLAKVIDDAFASEESDGAVAQRQLTAMLDDWWQFEQQEGRALIDDAHARSAVRCHVARIEAGETGAVEALAELTTPTAAASAARPLPADMEAALDAAEHGALHSLLDTLSSALEMASTADAALIHLDDAPRPAAVAETGGAAAFHQFWVKEPAAPAPSRTRDWFPVHIVLPLTAVTSVVALLVAWVR